MQVAQQAAADIPGVRVALVVAVVAIAVFWRAIIRIVLAVIVAILVVALGFGTVLLLQALHA